MKGNILKDQPLTKTLLWIGAAFFLGEFFLHFFGLTPLEHDIIFISTHDRYIAAYALTLSLMSVLVSFNLLKYKYFFELTMLMIFLGFVIGTIISLEGGYAGLFPVIDLDQKLGGLGSLFVFWYLFTFFAWLKNL